MNNLVGVNVDPLNSAPDASALCALGVNAVRLVARPDPRVATCAAACQAAGLRVLMVLAKESYAGGDDDYYLGTMNPDMVQIGNEPDQAGPSSWSMSQNDYLALWNRVAPAWKARGKTVITAGMASGQSSWLAPIWGSLSPMPSTIGVHPYGKDANAASNLLYSYKQTYMVPVLVSEWNRPADQIAAYMRMLSSETDGGCWFCYSDAMVSPMGLVDVNGNAKAEYNAIKEAINMALVEDVQVLLDRVAQLEKQGSDRDNVLVQMLQGQFNGFPSAEASLKALMGGDTNPANATWSAVPFPKP